MINVTSSFNRALNQDNRDYLEVIELTLRDNTTMTLTDEHIWGGTFCIDDAVSSDNELQIGSAIVNKFSFTINNLYDAFSGYDFYGARVVAKVALMTDVGLETIRKGTYVIAEDPVYNGDLIKVTCYDYMYFFDVLYPTGNAAITDYPATAYEVVSDICEYVGINLETFNFQNHNLEISAPPSEEATTCREVIAYVAQMCGCFARLNTDGELELKWFNRTELESIMSNILDGGVFDDSTPYATGDDADGGEFDPWETGDVFDAGVFTWGTTCHYISSLYSHDISVENVVVSGVRILVKTADNASADSIKTYSSGTNAYVIEIKNNPFITEANANTILGLLAQQLIGLTFRRARITHGSDPSIEAGDIAILWDRKQNVYPILVTHTSFTVGSPQSTVSAAQMPVLNSTARFGVETKNYVEMRQRLKSELQTMEEALQEAMEDASGLYMHEVIDQSTTPPSSIIYYHNKPELEDSAIRIVISDVGITVTPNGGESWYGLRVDGQMIASKLAVYGVNANWINTGALEIKDPNAPLTDPPLFYANCDTGEVDIVARSFRLTSGDTLQSVKDYSDTQLSAYQTYMSSIIGDMQDQIDGEISTWYYDYEPTTNNYPANTWTTTALKEEHQGDLFYWKSTGYSYRFLYDETNQTWDWEIISDTYITTAIAKAAEAKDAADIKRRIFVAQPVPPYDIGDLWVQGSTGDILRCAEPKATGTLFLDTDWVKASKYTDDTVVKAKYGTCSDDADVVNKVVTLAGFELYDGARITVFFAHSNTAASPTLNVNNTGAIPIYAKNAVITPTYYWRFTDIVDFVYVQSSNRWEMIVQNQRDIFMRLTNGGSDQGIYLSDGKVYINAAYINAGELSATRVRGGYLSIGGSASGNYKNGIIQVYNSSDQRVIQIDTNGIRVGNISSSLTSPHTTITPTGYIQTNRLRATGSVRAVGDPDATEKSLFRIPVVNTYETVGENCYFEVGDNGTTIKTLYEPSISGLYGIRGATLKAGGILQRSLEDFWRTYQTRAVGGYVCVDTDTMTSSVVKNYSKLSPTELIIHTRAADSDIVLSANGLEAYSNRNNVWIDTYFIKPDSFQLTAGNGNRGVVIGDLMVIGDLSVGGAKPRVIKTDDYADRTLYCYETASPLFGDVGEGTINEDGQCYIFIDPILSETIQTSQYQVFLQKYGSGDCYVSERKTDHFVVTGTPGMQFGWELKAKQFDLTQKRLDKYDTREHSLNMGNKINYASDAELHITEIMNERMAQNEYSNLSNNI